MSQQRGTDAVKQFLLARIVIDGDCWLWQCAYDKDGYALAVLDGKTYRAHRLAYRAWVGPIPDGLQLDHVRARGCRYRHCINPAHLEPVTGRENKLRGDTVNSKNIVKTRCPKGHPYSVKNTYWRNNKRHCRECGRARSLAYWRAKNGVRQ